MIICNLTRYVTFTFYNETYFITYLPRGEFEPYWIMNQSPHELIGRAIYDFMADACRV
jgi:hypothetical protein